MKILQNSAVGAVLALTAFLTGSPATAQTPAADGFKDIHRLTGSTSFHKPRLTNVASLTRMAAVRGMTADVRKVLADSGAPGVDER